MNRYEEAVEPGQRFRPGLMLLLFTVLGGPIGGLVLAATVIAFEPSQIEEAGLVFIWMFPLYGFLVGLPPAFLGGGLYSVLPARFQRILIAPMIGFLTALGVAVLTWLLILAGTGNRVPIEVCFVYAAAGASSALFCACLPESLGLIGAAWRASFPANPSHMAG